MEVRQTDGVRVASTGFSGNLPGSFSPYLRWIQNALPRISLRMTIFSTFRGALPHSFFQSSISPR